MKPDGTALPVQLWRHIQRYDSSTLLIFLSLSKNFSSTTLHRWKSNKEPSIFTRMLPPYHSNQKSSLSFIAHVKTPWLRKYFTHYCKKLTLLIRDQIFKLVQFNFQVGFNYTRACYFKYKKLLVKIVFYTKSELRNTSSQRKPAVQDLPVF